MKMFEQLGDGSRSLYIFYDLPNRYLNTSVLSVVCRKNAECKLIRLLVFESKKREIRVADPDSK